MFSKSQVAEFSVLDLFAGTAAFSFLVSPITSMLK